MNKKIENKLESAKRIWDEKKGKIAVIATVTTIGLVVILRNSNQTLDQFLKENDLEEDYWKFIGADEDDIEMFKSTN